MAAAETSGTAVATASLTPALPPPPGTSSDFNTHDNLYYWNILLQSVCLSTTTILMAVRCSVRIGLLKKWGLEDWLCVCSYSMFVGYASMVTYISDHGGGIHMYDLTHPQATLVLYWNNVIQTYYSMSILITKISLLYLYLKLFAPSKHTRNWWAIVVIMAANSAFYIGLMFAKIFECDPREAIWDKSIKNPKCVSLVGILDASGSWNTLSDIVVVSMPLLFIWKLRLSKEKRFNIISIFAVGLIAPIFSLIGVIIRVITSTSQDLTYYQPRLLFYAEAEITSGILCTCVPVLPRLYQWLRGDRLSSASRSHGERSSAYYGQRRRRTMLKNPHSDTQLLNSQYIELDDSAQAIRAPPKAVVTDIRGGAHEQGTNSPKGSDSGVDLSKGQIWMTTDIEVQREIRVTRNGDQKIRVNEN